MRPFFFSFIPPSGNKTVHMYGESHMISDFLNMQNSPCQIWDAKFLFPLLLVYITNHVEVNASYINNQ